MQEDSSGRGPTDGPDHPFPGGALTIASPVAIVMCTKSEINKQLK